MKAQNSGGEGLIAGCSICIKHDDFLKVTGEVIARRNGMSMSHFPFSEEMLPTKGHLLIEPDRHFTDLAEMSDEEAMALGLLCQKGVRVLKSKLGVEHVYVYRINDKTPHVHFHLIPRYPNTPKDFWGLKIMEYPQRPKIQLDEVKALSRDLAQAIELS